MGLFSGAPAAQRDAPFPAIPLNSAAGSAAPVSFSQSPTSSAESAMRKVAVGASIRLLCGLVSGLPRDCFTGTGDVRRPVTAPAFFTDPDGTGQGMGDWLEQGTASWLLRGNVFGRILARDSFERPAQILLQHPDRVTVTERPDGPEWRFGGKLVPAEDVWHRRMFPVPGQRLGLSPIALHAVTVLQGTAAEAFGLRWFLDGAHPSGILQNTDQKTIGQEAADTVKARFLAAVRGTREPVVIGSGWEYKAIQVNANESQFLDTQRLSSAECARIFGPGLPEVLGYETGGSMTYANVEQRSIDLLKFTLNRWLTKWEDVLSADILARPRYFKFNRGALLETDLLTRYRAHEIALRSQFKVVDEVRRLEDLPPVPWGAEPVQAAPAPTTVKVEE